MALKGISAAAVAGTAAAAAWYMISSEQHAGLLQYLRQHVAVEAEGAASVTSDMSECVQAFFDSDQCPPTERHDWAHAAPGDAGGRDGPQGAGRLGMSPIREPEDTEAAGGRRSWEGEAHADALMLQHGSAATQESAGEGGGADPNETTWVQFLDEMGDAYYYDVRTRETTWLPPPEFKVATRHSQGQVSAGSSPSSSPAALTGPPRTLRLLLVSSRMRNPKLLATAALPDVVAVPYDWARHSLNDILEMSRAAVEQERRAYSASAVHIASVAVMAHSAPGEVSLAWNRTTTLSNLLADDDAGSDLRGFWSTLGSFVEPCGGAPLAEHGGGDATSAAWAGIDLLASRVADPCANASEQATDLLAQMSHLTGLPVRAWRTLSFVKQTGGAAARYFDSSRLALSTGGAASAVEGGAEAPSHAREGRKSGVHQGITAATEQRVAGGDEAAQELERLEQRLLEMEREKDEARDRAAELEQRAEAQARVIDEAARGWDPKKCEGGLFFGKAR